MNRCSREKAIERSSKEEVGKAVKWLKETYPHSKRLVFYEGSYGYIGASAGEGSVIVAIKESNLPPYV